MWLCNSCVLLRSSGWTYFTVCPPFLASAAPALCLSDFFWQIVSPEPRPVSWEQRGECTGSLFARWGITGRSAGQFVRRERDNSFSFRPRRDPRHGLMNLWPQSYQQSSQRYRATRGANLICILIEILNKFLEILFIATSSNKMHSTENQGEI